ncbi:cell wall assembly regulator SMI1 [Xanthomonas sp. 3272]|uniref:SMI1/KNR4 family protein n=1 Tax=Xanthomonas arboricola TaxID=56448 RepID=UPI0014313913|nr:SMI1/KNR4 family protein [Xanthomonas arboricola]NJC00239.1 cell wall assembly regulator SMI1 [Xanthomonas arboricola]
MQKTWNRLEKWLRVHDSARLADLRAPAQAGQLADLAATLNLALPDELTESLCLHDGQSRKGPGLFGEMAYSSCLTIATEWTALTRLTNESDFDGLSVTAEKGIASIWWRPAWIRFAANGAGDHLCLDTAPARGGQVGQIIVFQHDHLRRRLVAPSLGAWLETAVQQASL